jgi:hypothetical protein
MASTLALAIAQYESNIGPRVRSQAAFCSVSRVALWFYFSMPKTLFPSRDSGENQRVVSNQLALHDLSRPAQLWRGAS